MNRPPVITRKERAQIVRPYSVKHARPPVLANAPKTLEDVTPTTKSNLLRSFKLVSAFSRDKQKLFRTSPKRTQEQESRNDLADFISDFADKQRRAAEAKAAYGKGSQAALTTRKRSAVPKESMSLTQRFVARQVDFMKRNSMRAINRKYSRAKSPKMVRSQSEEPRECPDLNSER